MNDVFDVLLLIGSLILAGETGIVALKEIYGMNVMWTFTIVFSIALVKITLVYIYQGKYKGKKLVSDFLEKIEAKPKSAMISILLACLTTVFPTVIVGLSTIIWAYGVALLISLKRDKKAYFFYSLTFGAKYLLITIFTEEILGFTLAHKFEFSFFIVAIALATWILSNEKRRLWISAVLEISFFVMAALYVAIIKKICKKDIQIEMLGEAPRESADD